MGIGFDNTYARDLEGFYTAWQGEVVPAPRLVRLNTTLARDLGLPPDFLTAEVLTGAASPEGAAPLAQVYAGHQFGGFSPQLGDGRALLLGEVIDTGGTRRDIALKGSGRTPYSRGGDGKAAIGPVLREYLVAEAMHAMGVPTTRALAAALTGEVVMRERPLPGAVLTRVAASHIRVGTFQYFAARQDHARLRRLLDYTIARHAPEVATAANPALALLAATVTRQAALVAHWMSVGFVHGVMNSDNMTLSGETIDYGPCAFMDAYDTAALFSSIDQGGRYAYGNQPMMAQWNLARLAEALLPLIDADTDHAIAKAVPVIDGFTAAYDDAWTARFRAKLGLEGADPGDATLIRDLLAAMQGQNADFTLTFRHLARDLRGGDDTRTMFDGAAALGDWVPQWHARIATDRRHAVADRMDAVNPLYIPRNHLVEVALAAATDAADFTPFERLLDATAEPFTRRDGKDAYALPAPKAFGRYTTFCGT